MRGNLGLLDAGDCDQKAVAFCPTHVDGSYPKQHLVAFLPATMAAPAAMDKRAVADPGRMPYRVSHVHDERGENFVVEYAERVECLDGVERQKIWYNCRKAHVEIDSEEHSAGHFAAQEAAWKHVTDVLDRGKDATSVSDLAGCVAVDGSAITATPTKTSALKCTLADQISARWALRHGDRSETHY